MSHAIRPNYDQLFLLPPSLDDWVPAGHPVRFVRDLLDAMDLADLGLREPAPGKEGRPHYAPDLLLKVWVYGWMERVRTSRALERACMRDLPFIWLTGNLHPDHNTLWRFFRDNKQALRRLFKKVVQVSVKAELVGFALHALDGTKVASASSMDTAFHKTKLLKRLKKIEKIIAESMAQTEALERTEDGAYAMSEGLQDAKARRAKIVEALAELDAAGTKHLHPKEPDARVMKSRSARTLAFNAQAVVDADSDLIVAADVTNEETDHRQLVPMVEQARENTGAASEQTVADTGYWGGEQIAEAERKHLPVLVNEQPESGTKGEYNKSCFEYDRERDGYICPRGELLPLESTCSPTTGKNYVQKVYRCRNRDCPVRNQCTTAKRGRSIKRTEHEDVLERQIQKQRDPAMKELLKRRGSIVEHIFGIVKGIDGFRRFTVRGLQGAKAQWALACLAVNLRKLHALAGGRLALTG